MRPFSFSLAPLVLVLSACLAAPGQARETISLAGDWRFQLDGDKTGEAAKWHARELTDTIRLPGTTDSNHKGERRDESPTDKLTRRWFWRGAAWYQRTVTIPEAWQGKRITLFLERAKHSKVWVNKTFCGWENTLSAPHVFDVTEALKTGDNTLTVLIDNSRLPPVGPAHQVDERTQTNWNGIVGRMELTATDPVWIEDVRVYPDAARKTARVRAVIGNMTGERVEGTLALACRTAHAAAPRDFATQTVPFVAKEERQELEFLYRPGGEVPLWSEFTPALLRLEVSLRARRGETTHADTRAVRFGMRDFDRNGSALRINGKPAFLRGRLDCANYPLTGYAPMDKPSWLRIYAILREWGLNHVRFHSWCPPAAAFEAADEMGFYLQPELPNKRSRFKAPENEEAAVHNIDRLDVESTETKVSLFDYGKREGELILRHFGNSPSFVMFTLGNELGRTQGMFELVDHFRTTDPRKLYAQGSNNMHWNPSLAEGDDFWVTGKVGKDTKPIRGSFSLFDFEDAPVEAYPPGTLDDFSASIDGVAVPLIGHETGQYQVFPDFRDIPKFTGVLRARNYEIFQDRLAAAGMLDQAGDFVKASGALSAICYREDIELALRTPGFGGIQLLDIMDFPGQGTALVGMLNVFMETKDVIAPESWREFCSETVPLLRMEKHAWTADETLSGQVQVHHFGPADLAGAVVTATITDEQSRERARFALPQTTVKQGTLAEIGPLSFDLQQVAADAPLKLLVTLEVGNTPHRNTYPVWVYPPEVDTGAPDGVLVTRSFQAQETRGHLADGGKVLLLPELHKLPHTVPGGFQPEFWSPMFAKAAKQRGAEKIPPGTLGILCDPASPALARFPTEFHSNWQWWRLVKNSRPIILDDTPHRYRPIVQVVDNFDRNHKLGLLAETKVGPGALLICAIDLLGHQDQPEARQLLHSLLRYMDSDAFAPAKELDPQVLQKLFPE